ncbi:hypothetical protein KM1_280930, partial [Entamoeba histolytica HM-3:IMSS]
MIKSADGKSFITKRPALEVVEPPQAKFLLVTLLIIVVIAFSNIVIMTS